MSEPQWVKCKNGHLYDPAANEECPHCPSAGRVSEPPAGRSTPIPDSPEGEGAVAADRSTQRIAPEEGPGAGQNQGTDATEGSPLIQRQGAPGTVVEASMGGAASGPGTVVEGAVLPPSGAAQPGLAGEGGDRSTRMVSFADDGHPQAMPIFAWLVVLEGKQQYADFRIDSDQTYLGASPECQIVVDDEFASGEHASIRCREGTFFITDLDSRNGTLVNDFGPDARIDRVQLKDGDEIRIGQTLMKFKCL